MIWELAHKTATHSLINHCPWPVGVGYMFVNSMTVTMTMTMTSDRDRDRDREYLGYLHLQDLQWV